MAETNDSVEVDFRDMKSDEKKKLTDLIANAVSSLPDSYRFEGKSIDISDKIRKDFMNLHAETMVVSGALKDKFKQVEWGIESWKKYDKSLEGLIDFANEFGDALGLVELKGGEQLDKENGALFMSMGKIKEYLAIGAKALNKDEKNPAGVAEKLIRDYLTKKDKYDVFKVLMAGIKTKCSSTELDGLNMKYFAKYGDNEKLQLAGLIAALEKRDSLGGIVPDFEQLKEEAVGLATGRASQWYKSVDAEDDRYTYKGKKTPIEYTQSDKAA